VPRLTKGGKWVYGWVVVRPEGEVTIPPEAWREYGFQAGDEAVFLPGSRRSGGFGLSTPGLMAALSEPMRAGRDVLGRGRLNEGRRLTLPSEVGAGPGDRLLAVRGSRYALGFVAQGPIYEAALGHPDVEVFE
jgi:hypothetical protein